VGSPARIMAQFFFAVLAQSQSLTRQTQIRVPLHPPIAPILVPLRRAFRVTEKLDLHLLELARAKRKIPRRDLVAKTLAHLRNAKRHPPPRTVADVAKIDKNPLCRLRSQKAASSSVPSAPTIVLNIKLKSRGSVSLHLSCSPGCLLGFSGHS